jgi:Calpain family cysteine protease/RTX calcium-binding nonapeptide repeat (4 copies)
MSKKQKNRNPHAPRQIEELEVRRMMAFTAAIATTIDPVIVTIPRSPVVVSGTNFADQIHISQDTSGNLIVNNSGVISTYSQWMVSKVVVNTFAGGDLIWADSNVSTPIEANGGDGNDSIYGGAAADSLSGGGGHDYIVGNDGNDMLDGGYSGTYYFDNTGNDSIWGMNGDDTLFAADYGNGMLNGGSGADSMYGYNGAETVTGGAGADYAYTQGGNDVIAMGTENDIVYAGAGDDVIHGDAGNDWLSGDDGNDKMYADAGDDVMAGGNGDDVLVSIGGGQYDMIGGNAGYDSFWADAETTERVTDADAAEMANGHVHRVSGFRSYHYDSGTTISVSRELLGQNLAEPINGGSSSRNFSTKPLFGNTGPNQDDIDQNGLGDCYFMSTLGAIAKANPDRIRQHVVELGDGTYAVQFGSSYVRVDGDLPTDVNGNLIYAGMGVDNSVWTAVMEKAWAFYRQNDSNWKSVESGLMDEVFGAMGASADTQSVSWWYKLWNNSDDLWNYVKGQLNAGKAVTVGTPDDAGTLVGSHAYMVDMVYVAADGSKHIVLRNPWGPNDTGGQPYVDITAGQLYDNIDIVQSAYV